MAAFRPCEDPPERGEKRIENVELRIEREETFLNLQFAIHNSQ
jgi:hypothetical protein